MKTEFSQLFNYVEKLRSRYLLLLSALNVYDSICFLSAQNKVGKKKAFNNVKTINNFGYFFVTTKEACRCFFLIELAKFFDRSKRSKPLTVYQALDYSRININKLSKDHFLKYHKDRKILPEIFEGYKELSLADLKIMNKKIKSKKNIIEKLINYRNKYLAHDDIDKLEIMITKNEIRQILSLLRSIIDLFYLRLDFASNRYNNFTEIPREETKLIVEYLQNYEKYRLKEIEEKYKVKL